MTFWGKLLCGGALLVSAAVAAPIVSPKYTSGGQLEFPEDYRQWVYLSSGLGMTYGPLAPVEPQSAPAFDNVFVNPESFRSFLTTGQWPDKTVFVLEIRKSAGRASINNGGHFQTSVMGTEVEVKDSHAPGGLWTFYDFTAAHGPSKAIARSASCYSCHLKNAAVENTFVQFYPTLLPIAEQKGTINGGFVR